MKYISIFLKAAMAVMIAFQPLPADAAPKKDGKKRSEGGEARKSAPKQSAPRQSAPRQAQRQNRAPARSKASVSRPKPQRQQVVKRSAPRPQARKSASASNVRRAPSVQRQQASRSRPERSASAGRSREVQQSRERKGSERKANVAERAVERSNASERRREAQQAAIQKRADRPDRADRQAAADRADRPDRIDRADRQDRADRPGRTDDTALNLGNAREGRDRANRPQDDEATRRPRDLTADGRDRRQGRADRRASRERFQVDRRPRENTAETRERQKERKQIRERVRENRQRQLAQREERNRDRVERLRDNRQQRIENLRNRRQALRAVRADLRQETRRAEVREARREIRNYWEDRAEEIRVRVSDRRDYLFDDDWWDDCRWRDRPIFVTDPWWWWRPVEFATVNVFLDAGWDEPVLYDYGTDVIYDESVVYVHGEPAGTPVEYSRRVIEQANPPVEVIAEAPVVENEWTPLGVWALVQEGQGDAVMFFQLSVDKKGVIRGAYVNVVSGEELPVAGQVDRATQRAAWHIGDEKEKVFEAGIANLSEQQASCLVHVAPGEMQNWLLVRMEGPELPNAPAAVKTNYSEPVDR